MRPRIGITYSDEINVEPYAEAIRASGGDPVTIQPGDSLDPGSLHGLVLGGGVDVDPGLYGQAPESETEAPNRDRDAMEMKLLADARHRDLPVLGICRGMQLLNVAAGGSLTQHVPGHAIRPEDKATFAHAAHVSPNSKLVSIYESDSLQINSRHHQTVAEIADTLWVSARAPDGTVEAVEDPERAFVIGVQWHPEDMAPVDSTQRRLFDEFVKAARACASASEQP